MRKGKEFYNYEGRQQKRLRLSKFEKERVNIKQPTSEKMERTFEVFKTTQRAIKNKIEEKKVK